MAVACWAARYSFADSEYVVVSGQLGEWNDLREEPVDTAVVTVYFEDLDSLAGR